MTKQQPKETAQEQRTAAYSRTWHDGWVVGQIEKTESHLDILRGLHEKATTPEGRAALTAAVSIIETAHKRQFPQGRETIRQHQPPPKADTT